MARYLKQDEYCRTIYQHHQLLTTPLFLVVENLLEMLPGEGTEETLMVLQEPTLDGDGQ